MDEKFATGTVLAIMVSVLGFAVYLIKRLAASKTEGARRFKIVLAGLFFLAVSAMLVDSYGFSGLAITLAMLGIVAWVYKGFKK